MTKEQKIKLADMILRYGNSSGLCGLFSALVTDKENIEHMEYWRKDAEEKRKAVFDYIREEVELKI